MGAIIKDLGSGTTVEAVNQLVLQFSQMRKMMKMMKKNGPWGASRNEWNAKARG